MLYWMCVCLPVFKCICIWYSAWACVCAFMCGCGCVSLGSARIMQSDSEIWHVINPLKHFHCLSSLPQCTNTHSLTNTHTLGIITTDHNFLMFAKCNDIKCPLLSTTARRIHWGVPTWEDTQLKVSRTYLWSCGSLDPLQCSFNISILTWFSNNLPPQWHQIVRLGLDNNQSK